MDRDKVANKTKRIRTLILEVEICATANANDLLTDMMEMFKDFELYPSSFKKHSDGRFRFVFDFPKETFAQQTGLLSDLKELLEKNLRVAKHAIHFSHREVEVIDEKQQ